MLLPNDDEVGALIEINCQRFHTSENFGFLPRLIVSLIKAHWDVFLWIQLYAVAEGAVRIASPVVVMYLLRSLSQPGINGVNSSYIFAAILAGLSIIQTVIHHILFFLSMRLGFHWKQAATGMIFRKLFKFQEGEITTGTGKLVNLISNDVSKFEMFAVYCPFFWVSILELIAVLLILIFQLNVAAGFAGVGVTVLFIPIQLYLAKLFSTARTNTAMKTDMRVRHISEIIDGVATLKSYAWENPFFSLLTSLRKQELRCIEISNNLRTVNLGLSFFAPPVASFSTFAVYWATGGVLTLPVVFSTLSLFIALRVSMGKQWTGSIESGSEAIASSIRIQEFLSLPEGVSRKSGKDENHLTTSAVHQRILSPSFPMKNTPTGDLLLKINNASYCYPKAVDRIDSSNCNEEINSVLSNIDFSVSKGEVVVVVGPVGSGKSSLLVAALGEMKETKDITATTADALSPCSRYIATDTRIAYCSQRPWILATSVLSNITLAGSCNVNDSDNQRKSNRQVDDKGKTQENSLLKASFDSSNLSYHDYKTSRIINEQLYKLAVESTNVVADFLQWEDYDNTEIGERGISISGGQKARIGKVITDFELLVFSAMFDSLLTFFISVPYLFTNSFGESSLF